LRELIDPRFVNQALLEISKRVEGIPGEEVGRGAHGIVYNAGGGQAVKLTRDRGEVQAMATLKGVKHKNLVRVDDVLVIHGNRGGTGVVIRELVGKTLESLDQLEGAAVDLTILVDAAAERAGEFEDVDPDESELEPYQAVSRAMSGLYNGLGDVAEDYEPNSVDKKVLLGVRSAIGKLKGLGIFGVDFPPRNIAIDDSGDAVVFDIGAVEFLGKTGHIKTVYFR
jgi:hypothetical protein